MSGGGIDYAHTKSAGQLIEQHYDQELRSTALALEEHGGYAVEELSDEETAQLIALLRMKADRIEAARKSVQRAFEGRDINKLLKALDTTISFDTPPETVAEAWRDYGMESDSNE